MTKERYEETQKMPDRIKGTDKGKAAARIFVRAVRQRYAVEFPDDLKRYDTNRFYRYTELMNLFAKYLAEIEYGPEKNSAVVTIVEHPDYGPFLWSNYLYDGENGKLPTIALYRMFRRYKKWVSDLKSYKKEKCIYRRWLWRKHKRWVMAHPIKYLAGVA